VVGDSHHFDEAQDPHWDPHQTDKSNPAPDPHQTEKRYSDSHEGDAIRNTAS
jgi:hypothetical protein